MRRCADMERAHRAQRRRRALDPAAVELAVAASVRHRDTGYDELLKAGIDRTDARERLRAAVVRVLDGWQRT